MFRSAALALALCLATITAQATTVSVIASGYQADFSDPSGLLPFPSTPDGTEFTVGFTYDSGTPDVQPDPLVGTFGGAITDFSLSIGNITLPGLSENLIEVSNGASTANGQGDEYWVARTFTDAAQLRTSITFLLVSVGGNVLGSDALVEPTFPWSIGFIDYSVEDRTDPNQRVILAMAYARLGSVGVSSVPAPATVWLLGTALGAAGVMRRWVCVITPEHPDDATCSTDADAAPPGITKAQRLAGL